MRIPRLLLLSLLTSACVASMAAQWSPSQVAPPSQTKPDLARRAPQFQLKLPGSDQSGQDGTRIERFPPPSASLPMTVVTQQSTTCYFIQAFHFARVTPESDAVKLTGVSTCQPASEFQMRDVVGPR